MRMSPQTCHVPSPFLGGFTGTSSLGRAMLDIENLDHPATCLILAIISSTAFSGVHLSFATRLTAFAHTFSLLRIVNFQFLVNSKGTVPAENCSCTILRCGSSVQNLRW